MIDYHSLDREEWAWAAVRKKLDDILFVYYQWLPNAPLGRLVVTDIVRWQPDTAMIRVFEEDWLAVRRLVRAGRAEDVSESLGIALVAATKGAGGPPSRTQPHSIALVSQRAWALKPAFLKSVLERHRGAARRVFEVTTTLEDRALSAISQYVGQRIRDVEDSLGLAPSAAKHRASRVIELLVGLDASISRSEFADGGLT